MHRHGYTGRKLSKDTDQRRALIRGLVTSLVLYESITTTEAKAKEISPYFDKMVTAAKAGTLAGNRKLQSFLLTDKAVAKMQSEIALTFATRSGGYTRIIKLQNRLGDNSPMAQISLVDKIVTVPKDEPKPKKAVAKQKPEKEAVNA